ncbi:hypothetical protein FS749_009997 [Ceratobasidium sp. UAMH 11750]|nr:hypothetical protein FS749_009997 [Ceratobasidium sp. UAMH 11750]
MAPRLFEINELLHLVLSSLTVPDLATNLTVGRRWFDVGISLVWNELMRVDPLFALLQDEPSVYASRSQARITASIPDQEDISAAAWSRFNLYASQVRKLNTLSSGCVGQCKWLGLEKLLELAPVVPHAHTIQLSLHNEVYPDSWACHLVIKLFLGESTARLICRGPRSGLKTEHVVSILKSALALKSPLAHLNLPTGGHGDATKIFASFLPDFKHLESLYLSMLSLDSASLDQIRRLPRLRTFSVIQPLGVEAQWQQLGHCSDWKGEAFPSLKTLCVLRFTPGDIQTLLSRYPILLACLSELNVWTHGPCSRDTGSFVAAMLALIGRSARQLRKLTASFTSSLEAARVGLDALTPIFPLELERLELYCLRFTGTTGCSALHGRWPRLTHFVIPHQPATPSDLLQLARRRRLQVLHVDVTPPGEDDAVMLPDERIEHLAVGVQLLSEYRLGKLPTARMRSYAAFLLRCWPNLVLQLKNMVPHWPPSLAGPNGDGFEELVREINDLRRLTG